MNQPILNVSGVDKTFVMHLQGGQRLPVLRDFTLVVQAGECVALGGVSGAGKNSVLKMVYGNYAVDRGSIVVKGPNGPVDIAIASPRQVLAARRDAMGYVSQFLIREKRARGTALLGIVHDAEVRGRVADRVVDAESFAATAPAGV